MTVADLLRELSTFLPDSTVELQITDSGRETVAEPQVVYWDAETHVVVIEGEEG